MTTVVVVVVDVCSDVIFFVLIQSLYLPFKHFNTPGGKYSDLMNDDYVSTRVVRCTMQEVISRCERSERPGSSHISVTAMDRSGSTRLSHRIRHVGRRTHRERRSARYTLLFPRCRVSACPARTCCPPARPRCIRGGIAWAPAPS